MYIPGSRRVDGAWLGPDEVGAGREGGVSWRNPVGLALASTSVVGCLYNISPGEHSSRDMNMHVYTYTCTCMYNHVDYNRLS